LCFSACGVFIVVLVRCLVLRFCSYHDKMFYNLLFLTCVVVFFTGLSLEFQTGAIYSCTCVVLISLANVAHPNTSYRMVSSSSSPTTIPQANPKPLCLEDDAPVFSAEHSGKIIDRRLCNVFVPVHVEKCVYSREQITSIGFLSVVLHGKGATNPLPVICAHNALRNRATGGNLNDVVFERKLDQILNDQFLFMSNFEEEMVIVKDPDSESELMSGKKTGIEPSKVDTAEEKREEKGPNQD
jgi:hypothetical protein